MVSHVPRYTSWAGKYFTVTVGIDMIVNIKVSYRRSGILDRDVI
jgi:hypothetical protein